MRQQSNSGVRAKVNFTSKGSHSGVDPVVVKRSKFVSLMTSIVLVAVLTRSTQAGRSTKLFFLRYWAKASMKSLAGMSLTVKKVCSFYPSIGGEKY